uniref:Uncharacterized protein n=1 Tax=Maylandia zebra TaxID=106582 RepID=A0A3P9CTQ9_9CICH
MTLSAVQQLFLLCLFICFGCWSTTGGVGFLPYSLILLPPPPQFLFHYSKARNSVGAVQKESHSVHPLMRLSPKLSQRRKKKVVLLVRTQI